MNEKKQTVSCALNGDKQAFEQLYQETCRGVYFTCLSFLKNETDANDVMQETYLTAFMKISALDDPESFGAWVNRIAVNKCRDFLKKRSPDYVEEEILENVPETEEDFLPDEYVTNRAKRKIVMKIMEECLSEVLYQTVIMFYFHEMSAADIAKEMNCPVGTVTYRLTVARKKIKEAVVDYEENNDDRLHALVGVPFLTRLFRAEAESLDIPKFNPEIVSKVVDSVNNAVTSSAKNGGKNMLKSVKSKIIAGITAVAVVGGTITTGVVLSGKSDDNKEGKNVKSSQNASANKKGAEETPEEPDIEYIDKCFFVKTAPDTADKGLSFEVHTSFPDFEYNHENASYPYYFGTISTEETIYYKIGVDNNPYYLARGDYEEMLPSYAQGYLQGELRNTATKSAFADYKFKLGGDVLVEEDVDVNGQTWFYKEFTRTMLDENENTYQVYFVLYSGIFDCLPDGYEYNNPDTGVLLTGKYPVVFMAFSQTEDEQTINDLRAITKKAAENIRLEEKRDD